MFFYLVHYVDCLLHTLFLLSVHPFLLLDLAVGSLVVTEQKHHLYQIKLCPV